jgi:tryptophanyl-tRNA synthetase
MKRLLTGDRPTGRLHLGHYVGTLLNRVKLQHEYEVFFIIADLHMLTTRNSKADIRESAANSRELVLDALGAGIDPDVATFYLQSAIPEIAEMALFFQNLVSVPRLERIPSLKEMARDAHKDEMPFGLLGYPVLQAADILSVNASLVPVGKDNAAHVEVAREIARRFNSLYGDVFVIPEALIGNVPTLVGTDGTAKMSKSLGNAIFLSDDEATVRTKVKAMYTDPRRVRADIPGTIEGNPVFIYHDAFNANRAEVEDLKRRYRQGQVGDVEVKDKLANAINHFLDPIRDRRARYADESGFVEALIDAGTRKVRRIARSTVKEMRKAMGFKDRHAIRKLADLGQSVWYDYIRRDLYQGPELQRLIEEDGLRGMTSNPTLFAKAITETELYDEGIRQLASKGVDPAAIFESLAVEDVRGAADKFRPLYESARGDDGFVSIEVRPQLARDSVGSIEEARRLWSACDRPNVMVKIPATAEGIPAIRQCLAEGININITLLFSVSRYQEVMEAYLSAMEQRVAAGQPVDRIRSVASFFVSRVDTNANKKLDAIMKDASRSERDRQTARDLRGRVAIANARIAYQSFEQVFSSSRFARLKEKGVRLQRPLWASTSTKDPAYPDLYYVEALVAPDTVDTMPPDTFTAYRDRGEPRVRIHDDLRGAHSVFEGLAELKIDAQRISLELEEEGARKFIDSYDDVLKAIRNKSESLNPASLKMSR